MVKIAVFSPGPSYSDPSVRRFAGWTRILDLYKEGLEELGYEVFIPHVDLKLIDQASTVSKILSYDIVAAQQIPGDAELFLGPPGYSIAQMMAGSDNNWGCGMKNFLYVWNNADWWRDQQLAEEYKRFGQPYDLSPSWRWINRTALEMADHIIACSPWVKKTYAEIVPEDKISIAFWGVDSEKFHPNVDPPEGFKVLFVGGDPIRKGLTYLMEAVKGLSGIEIWIVGCAPFMNEAIDRLFLYGGNTVRQFGMLPHVDIVNIYQQCHVLVCPTLEDGIALCVQEAMASGLPVITSPETAEVFEHMETGIKVDYRDVEGIRRALLFLRDNPIQRALMGKKARALSETQTWDKTKEEFKEIIRCQMV